MIERLIECCAHNIGTAVFKYLVHRCTNVINSELSAATSSLHKIFRNQIALVKL